MVVQEVSRWRREVERFTPTRLEEFRPRRTLSVVLAPAGGEHVTAVATADAPRGQSGVRPRTRGRRLELHPERTLSGGFPPVAYLTPRRGSATGFPGSHTHPCKAARPST